MKIKNCFGGQVSVISVGDLPSSVRHPNRRILTIESNMRYSITESLGEWHYSVFPVTSFNTWVPRALFIIREFPYLSWFAKITFIAIRFVPPYIGKHILHWFLHCVKCRNWLSQGCSVQRYQYSHPQWSKKPSLELIGGFYSPSLIRTSQFQAWYWYISGQYLMSVQSFLSCTLCLSDQGVPWVHLNQEQNAWTYLEGQQGWGHCYFRYVTSVTRDPTQGILSTRCDS